MVESRVGEWLDRGGLAHYRANFQGMREGDFLELVMRDYGKFGVGDPGEKHVLYQLIKQVRRELGLTDDGGHDVSTSGRPAAAGYGGAGSDLQAGAGASPQMAMGHPNDILDLEEHDGDLLPEASHPFQASPLAAAQQGGGAAADAEQGDPPKIRVVVRKRPINRKERERSDDDVVDMLDDSNTVVVSETKVKVDLTKYVEQHQFNFDEALPETCTNDDVYSKTVGPLVPTLFANGKATCFAYGQTGSGKTHTMSPLPIRAAADILRWLAKPQLGDVALFVSCFEIYGNKVFDLLNERKKLSILEDAKKRVVVVGLKEHNVSNVELVKSLIEEANHRRSVGSTAANADSSRSHSIMQFALKQLVMPQPLPRGYNGQGTYSRQVGKISFIDLAGSERGADTFDNNRQTRLEGAEINKSLLALKECIRALDNDARHVPFRGSKLTAVLRDSFLGDTARTVMIANISPTASCVEHTLNTLRYADRVKELRKEKAERAPGGVTPGDEAYYAAAARAAAAESAAAEPPAARVQPRQPATAAGALSARPPAAPANNAPNYGAGGGVAPFAFAKNPSPAAPEWGSPDADGGLISAGGLSGTPGANAGGPGGLSGEGEDEELLLGARAELMDSILEDEEEIIAVHRQQIEESMEIVRREMNILAEVDQPGSAIDQYVDQLEAILSQKAEGIRQLQLRLERFKQKLRQEEIMSSTVTKKRSQQRRT